MKIQIASDLHLEHFFKTKFADSPTIEHAPGADVLVLAGDIACSNAAFEAFQDWPVPVLYVPGNHEYYGSDFDTTRAHARQLNSPIVRNLDKNVVVIKGVRFLGTTLWTDYALDGSAEWAMMLAKRAMTDHRAITRGARPFSPQDALEQFIENKEWLESKLDDHFDGKTVVITHHGVHPAGIAREYFKDALNPAFFSDLRHLLGKADLWVHGHTHTNVDIEDGDVRIVANPRGYPMNARNAASFEDIVFENKGFDPLKTVTV